MRTQPVKWMYVWRAVATAALVGSSLLVPACNGGRTGTPGAPGTSSPPLSATVDPLSAVVAAFLDSSTAVAGKSTVDIPTYVKALVADPAFADGDAAGTFPVAASATDTVRTIPGIAHNVVARWMDTMTFVTAGRVNLVNDAVGVAGNKAIVENVAHATFTVSGMSGGAATAAATGRLQAITGAQIVDGDSFTLDDGVNLATTRFEFNLVGGVTSGVAVNVQTGWSVHRVVLAIVDAINSVGASLGITAYDEPLFGSHCDFLGYFGDNYNTNPSAPGNAPQWNGSGNSGWLWVNNEYISTNEFPNFDPAVGLAPRGHPLVLAKFMRTQGILGFDPAVDANWDFPAVDLYIRYHKKQIGGTWVHVVRDPGSGEWAVDKQAANRRFDGTGTTLSRLTGLPLNAAAHDDFGNALATGIIPGTMGNCAGVITPWGTVLSGEENVQDYYGDFEQWWDGNNQFVLNRGANAGAAIAPTFTPSLTSTLGLTTDPNGRQQRDTLGYVVEIDPFRPPNEAYQVGGTGNGHRKMGSFGRIRWENACIVVDANWKLNSGTKLVMYGTDDRRGGRIFKWISAADVDAAWVADMVANKASIRTLLDTGKLFVGHFQGIDNRTGWSQAGSLTTPFTSVSKGNGKWIEISTANVTDDAPNGAILGAGTKVGAALMNNGWNNMGGFANDDAVRKALFSACNKIGVFELNRPEEIVHNPIATNDGIYVALTNFAGRPPVLGPDGVLGQLVVVPSGTATTVTVTDSVANGAFMVVATSAARAVIVAAAGAQIADGETLTVDEDVHAPTVFTFKKTASAALTDIVIADTDTAQAVAGKIIARINGITDAVPANDPLMAAASGPTNDTAGRRADTVGRIWRMDDGATPATSTTFQFWEVFTGISGTGRFDAANPDNIAITKDGSVWFGTDGNFGTNGRADAVYYLDMTKTHPTVVGAQGRAYRILAVPADAEHTGPCFTSDMRTLFNSIQHPGEVIQSTWPNGQP